MVCKSATGEIEEQHVQDRNEDENRQENKGVAGDS